MNKLLNTLFIAFVTLILSACSENSSSSDSSSSKYDKTPYLVYTYDGNKEIVLYDNPRTASVNGLSGSWTDGHKVCVNGESLETQEYYIVRYGSNTCVIWAPKGMIYWGTEAEAFEHLNSESAWTICHKKRF